MHIKIKKGLDIPIQGKPEGNIQEFPKKPTLISLNLDPFEDVRLKLLKKAGEKVLIGEPICEDKEKVGRFFVSPASGTIRDVRRGSKRRITDVIIELDNNETYYEYPKNVNLKNKEELIQFLLNTGSFTHIKQRPFGHLANPRATPRSIFIKALESAPFVPPAEFQVMGHEEEFQIGLTALSQLTSGNVHLIYSNESTFKPFIDAKDVVKHTAEGPHPIANHSLHIHSIDPITSTDDVIWTLNARDVVSIGYALLRGKYFIEKVISIAGPGIVEGRTGYFRVREGFPIANLAENRLPKFSQRLISGDPLMGHQVGMDDFLGFNDYVFCVIPENKKREFLHFFRLGSNKYTFTKAYASGHVSNENASYSFTTNQHGEPRAFIEPRLYDKVMPLNISTMLLVKSLMAKDFDLAEELGLLEVDPEDFALPTFVCPSKIEMTEIVKHGLQSYAVEVLGETH